MKLRYKPVKLRQPFKACIVLLTVSAMGTAVEPRQNPLAAFRQNKGLLRGGPNGPGPIGKAQYIKPWGEEGEPGVLLDRSGCVVQQQNPRCALP